MTVYFEAVPRRYRERALYLEAERLAFLPSALRPEQFDTSARSSRTRRQTYETRAYGLPRRPSRESVPEGATRIRGRSSAREDLSGAPLDALKPFSPRSTTPGTLAVLAGAFEPGRGQAKNSSPKYSRPLAPAHAPRSKARPSKPEARKMPGRPRCSSRGHGRPNVADAHPDPGDRPPSGDNAGGRG